MRLLIVILVRERPEGIECRRPVRVQPTAYRTDTARIEAVDTAGAFGNFAH